MGKIITAKIDVTKIPKDRIFEGKNGKYIDILIFENDEPDKFDNTHNIQLSRSKEERASNAKKIYLGNGKWLDFGQRGQQQRREAPRRDYKPKAQETFAPDDDDSTEIPF